MQGFWLVQGRSWCLWVSRLSDSGDQNNMSRSINRGGLGGRLASHFAVCGATAMGIAAASASAEVIYSGPVNLNIASSTNGLYLKPFGEALTKLKLLRVLS